MNPSPTAATFTPYQALLERTREIALLQGATALLSWDQQTYMPPKAISFRADQLGYFSGRAHRLFTSPDVGGWIEACEDASFGAGMSEGEAAATNIRQWRYEYDRATRIPVALVENFQRARAHANEVWQEARKRADFAMFAPHLRNILSLSREMAEHWGYEQCPYDALIEGFEPGARTATLQTLFDGLRPALKDLLGPALERSARAVPGLLAGHYPKESQAAFNREVAEAIGFDFEAGGIATTAHPFCSRVGPGDCRLTTRYDEGNFLVSLYGVLHEAGHGMYEQGFESAAFGTPAGTASSLGIHESQSRLWENQVGRAREFWEHWLPRAAAHFPALSKRTPEELFAAVNLVSPSYIRVEADEITYDSHIILRFGIERRLLDGSLKVEDVPAVWNEEFHDAFGLRVPDDAQGCLQDVHWSEGLIGYFPTYTLGNLNAAQLYGCASLEIPGLQSALADGRYAELLEWLRAKIHRQGQRLKAPALIEAATGEPTTAKYYIDSLRRKFVD